MRHKRCRECSGVFRPSSMHLRCPACRCKDLCPCGRTKQVKSATCGMCRTEVGEANGNWKGGRTRHKAGYVMVHVPGHPRAGKSRYVFEHILVAEEMLGRHLIEGETVHHVNGLKDDNRPEHLELWTRPQPSGSRVAMQSNGRTPFTTVTSPLAHLRQSFIARNPQRRWSWGVPNGLEPSGIVRSSGRPYLY
jgi:hypothetical protein